MGRPTLLLTAHSHDHRLYGIPAKLFPKRGCHWTLSDCANLEACNEKESFTLALLFLRLRLLQNIHRGRLLVIFFSMFLSEIECVWGWER